MEAETSEEGMVPVNSRSSCIAGALVVALLLAACGSGEQAGSDTAAEGGLPAEATIEAGSPGDRRIALGLQSYLGRNCPDSDSAARVPDRFRDGPLFDRYKRELPVAVAFCESIVAIEVEDSRILVYADLGEDADRETTGRVFCSFVQGSDVADFTDGHELVDETGETVRTCLARDG